ncbi:M20 family metallopeptidase, partial [Nocardioides sp.]
MSALLDGQLSAKETEEAWAHVYSCHACRDLVEREGWVKTRLAGLSTGERTVPSNLKGSLLSMPPGDAILAEADAHPGARRHLGAAALGGGALGAAMLGVL